MDDDEAAERRRNLAALKIAGKPPLLYEILRFVEVSDELAAVFRSLCDNIPKHPHPDRTCPQPSKPNL